MRFLAVSLLVAIVRAEVADHICSLTTPKQCKDGKAADVDKDAIYFSELNIANTRHVYACAEGQYFCGSVTNVDTTAYKPGCYRAKLLKRDAGPCSCTVFADDGKTITEGKTAATEYVTANHIEGVNPGLVKVFNYYTKASENNKGCSALDFKRTAAMPADLAGILEEKTNSGSPLFFTFAGIGAMVLARVF